jgi:hypothetical protein
MKCFFTFIKGARPVWVLSNFYSRLKQNGASLNALQPNLRQVASSQQGEFDPRTYLQSHGIGLNKVSIASKPICKVKSWSKVSINWRTVIPGTFFS